MNLEALREQRITADLERTRLRRGGSSQDDQIIAAIEAAREASSSIFLVLSQTPEQFEDILIVLVNDDEVARIETDRANRRSSVTLYSVETYKRDLKGVAAVEFDVARRYARRLLAST